ncbi:ATP-binding Cassette (ABC) Superfamily [Phytophthora cinnamomi]|uniref:ATP-binding Cassette (ABC) Superfamily n=1 Tax=Phytophthora cinnamomi TaxID=4785 RepID=UPI003559B433|nr:ATP-binding Cassette (ABC) Superfamily [Phytophthora cinnamomi]
MEYHSDHRFNTMIKTINTFPAPSFKPSHEALCNDSDRQERGYQYCLRFQAAKTELRPGADRTGPVAASVVLNAVTPVTALAACRCVRGAQALDYNPILAFGSLLGAVRNGSMIPFTEDTDIAYVGDISGRVNSTRRFGKGLPPLPPECLAGLVPDASTGWQPV